jgi:uncharacterized protein involved in exopolysaccharide biosynthesis
MKKLNEDKVDWINVIKAINNRRKNIIISVFFFTIIGILVAVNLEEVYTSRVVFVSQSNMTTRGNLGNLASIAGMNLGNMNTTSEIPVGLYPKIAQSITFRKELIKTPIKFSDIDSLVNYQDYYENIYSPSNLSLLKKYTIGLPKLILSSLRPNQDVSFDEINPQSEDKDAMLSLTQSEFNQFKRLSGQLSVQPNEKDGYIELQFSMPDPIASAEMALKALTLLQNEVIAYKVNTAKEQLSFTESRLLEKKTEFEQIQNKLSEFRDRNLNLTSAAAAAELQRIEAEYNLILTLYQDLARQVEMSKLQVKKDTPIFTIIEPVSIPFQRSAPNKPFVVIVFFILGVVFSVTWASLENFYFDFKKKWLSKQSI